MPPLKILIEISVHPNFKIHSDSARLRSIINLLSNALQYRDPPKPNPTIQTTCARTPDQWTLTVQDHGQGIQPDRQDKIFNMFYRGHEKSMGSGLGLFIVKETVATLAGTITFESEFGVGSVFRVEFPIG